MSSNVKVAAPQMSAPFSKESVGVNPLRRVGAIVYDTLLVAALLMAITPVFFLFTGAAVTPSSGWLYYVYRAVLVAVICGFFVYFWTAKGRTLGMQAWRIRIERLDGSLPTSRDVLARLLVAAVPWIPAAALTMMAVQSNAPHLFATIAYCSIALVPLNYACAWFDEQRRSWHDRFLQTRIVRQK